MEPEKSLAELVMEGCAEVVLEAHAAREDGTCGCGGRWPCDKAAFAIEVLGTAAVCPAARAVSLPHSKKAVEYDCTLPAGHPPNQHAWRQR